MRREDYERTYGRRGHTNSLPTPISSSQDTHSRKSRRRMKCLISIGLILPALAAVIGVAAWAVSADVVMNSGSSRVNKADNQLLQNMPGDHNNNNKDIFRRDNPSAESDSSDRSSQRNPPSLPRKPPSSEPSTTHPTEEPTDVGAILSKLISASGAASGGSGPRFVVVAPLPDHDKAPPDSSSVSRADNGKSDRFDSKSPPSASHLKNLKHFDHDLMPSESESYHNVQLFNPPRNATYRVGVHAAPSSPSNPRRSGETSFVIDLSSNNHRFGFNPKSLEKSGFEPYQSKQGHSSGSMQHKPGPPPPPPSQPKPQPNFMTSGSFPTNSKVHPPQGYYSSPNHPSQHHKHPPKPPPHPHSKQGPPMVHNMGNFDHQSFNPHQQMPGRMNNNGGYGLKPIQKHHQHHDPLPLHALQNKDNFNPPHGPPPRADESNRWGSIGFPGGPHEAFGPKPPEGISLSISSPSSDYSPHGHAEPISVIKSIFLPFLPKPKVNLNARVVFGVVLDKGIGLGGQKKEAPHHHLPIY